MRDKQSDLMVAERVVAAIDPLLDKYVPIDIRLRIARAAIQASGCEEAFEYLARLQAWARSDRHGLMEHDIALFRKKHGRRG